MVEHFLSEGDLVVYTEGAAQPRREYVTGSDGDCRDEPLVVLVDEGSASASEIFAGAIQDHDRGIIMGETTYGKGLVQQLQRLGQGGQQIKFTIGKYYTSLS